MYFTFIVIVLKGIGSFYSQADVSLTHMLMWICVWDVILRDLHKKLLLFSKFRKL